VWGAGARNKNKRFVQELPKFVETCRYFEEQNSLQTVKTS